jgi:small-conductance mechanosensitive channel
VIALDTKTELDTLRQNLVKDLNIIQDGIKKDLKKITNKPVKDILLKILDRQDKLFEYYVGTREELVKSTYLSQQSPPKKEVSKNAYTESMDLLSRYF